MHPTFASFEDRVTQYVNMHLDKVDLKMLDCTDLNFLQCLDKRLHAYTSTDPHALHMLPNFQAKF